MPEHAYDAASAGQSDPIVISTDSPRATGDGELEERTGRGALLEVSNAMVRLYKEAFGRGPTKARANFAGPDTLVIVLENSLTVAERNLAAMGEHQRLREARMFFQYALETEFRTLVERILGRRTIAFVSGIDTRRDVAVEAFTLQPVHEGSAGADGFAPAAVRRPGA